MARPFSVPTFALRATAGRQGSGRSEALVVRESRRRTGAVALLSTVHCPLSTVHRPPSTCIYGASRAPTSRGYRRIHFQ